MRELYCFSDFTHLRMLENNNRNVIKMIHKVFAFLELYFLQQYPTFLKKGIQKIRGKKFKFTLETEFEIVSLLSVAIMTVQIIHSSFSLFSFICIVQSLLVKTL